MIQNQSNRVGIVLNRMFNGKYIEDYVEPNLGHEIINLFKADNGKNYIYLQAWGTFHKKHDRKIAYTLLVKAIEGEQKLEILGKAEICEDIYNPFIPNNEDIQDEYIKTNDITYGGVPLLDLYKENNYQQDICVTFLATKVVKPVKPLFISFNSLERGQNASNILVFKDHKQAKTSLKQYIYPGDKYNMSPDSDYNRLKAWIDNDALWGNPEDIKQVSIEELDKEIHSATANYWVMLKLFKQRIIENRK
jgi:hypothetical protein